MGFLGFAFLLPYLVLCLTHPDWSGHVGRRLSSGLFSLLGQGALGLPVLVAYAVLSLAGLRLLRHTRYAFSLPLFLVCLQLIERSSSQGGWLGGVFDGLLLLAFGPGGAWLLTVTFMILGVVAFVPRIQTEASSSLLLVVERLRDWRLRLATASRAKRGKAPMTEDPAPEHSEESARVVPLESPSTARLPGALLVTTETPPVLVPAAVEASSEEPVDRSVAGGYEGPVLEHPASPVDSSEPVAPATVERTSPCDLDGYRPDETEMRPTLPPVAAHEDALVLEPGLHENVRRDLEKQSAIPTAREFELPPLALLDDVPANARSKPIEDKSKALLDALDAFGVKATLLDIVRGPTVTRYELQPARGVKVSKFTSLTNDIALALASTAIRIEAPIPGKSAIGIEIPNEHTDLVVLKDILRAPAFTRSKGLTVALGLDLSGRPVVTDLQKMPHLLVAGTTGSGKSVCVNGLIISLLYRFTPDQLQLMMVDPKQVELSIYEDIPHLVGFNDSEGGEIIVDPKKAAQALHQVVDMMESRYTLFAEARARNLAEYNAKVEQPLPWFVVIIDELADLMMVASKSVETSICRIAQKARAAGIHLVLATQRPSADVITGLIKVNIPSRAAFAVSSQVDSRVILDSGGAEHLLGKGDMLFLPVDASDPKRIQGSYVGNEEISRVVEFWKGQGLPDNRIEFELKEDPLALDDENEDDSSGDDALLEEGLRVILRRDQASASMLQTELKVGYARARRLLIAMEKRGWIGPQEGSKPRKIVYSGPPPDEASPSE